MAEQRNCRGIAAEFGSASVNRYPGTLRRSAGEAEMREIVTLFLGLIGLTAVSLQAAPAPHGLVQASLGVAPLMELVVQGCGLGWHRGRWQDPSGEWHWGHCFPSWR
jgi:hypothetical protein